MTRYVSTDFDWTLARPLGENMKLTINHNIFNKLIEEHKNEARLFIVTTRSPSKENQDEIANFLEVNNINIFSGVFFTNHADKWEILDKLNVSKHFDDDLFEHFMIERKLDNVETVVSKVSKDEYNNWLDNIGVSPKYSNRINKRMKFLQSNNIPKFAFVEYY